MSDPTSIPPGSVIITPEHMWKTIGEIQATGNRTETAIAELRLSLTPALTDLRQDVETNARIEREHHEKHEEKFAAQEKAADARLRPLEQQSWASRWIPPLVTSVIVAVISGTAVYLATHFLAVH